MTDLHDRLKSVITEALEKAKAAAADDSFVGAWDRWIDGWLASIDRDPVAAHIAAWDPSTVIRHCEHALAVLERHQRATLGGAPLASYDECRCVNAWPCIEITDLARAWGLEETP